MKRDGDTVVIVRELQGFLARIVWIREGDDASEQNLALEDLEHDFAAFFERVKTPPTTASSLTCPDCTLAFKFPGQLSEHRAFVHGVALQED
jgi:hypothetical protein